MLEVEDVLEVELVGSTVVVVDAAAGQRQAAVVVVGSVVEVDVEEVEDVELVMGVSEQESSTRSQVVPFQVQ